MLPSRAEDGDGARGEERDARQLQEGGRGSGYRGGCKGGEGGVWGLHDLSVLSDDTLTALGGGFDVGQGCTGEGAGGKEARGKGACGVWQCRAGAGVVGEERGEFSGGGFDDVEVDDLSIVRSLLLRRMGTKSAGTSQPPSPDNTYPVHGQEWGGVDASLEVCASSTHALIEAFDRISFCI